VHRATGQAGGFFVGYHCGHEFLELLKIDKKIVQAGLGEQILQIHDSILIEAPEQNAEEIAKILKTEMENIAPELKIPLKVDVKTGKSWAEF
jgi:DNA polymerase-1